MKLAVSNIAWAKDDRLDAYAILHKLGISGLEIAPGLLFHAAKDPFSPPVEVAEDALREIADFGLSLVSMQSLLFGVEGAALFGSEAAQETFRVGMRRAIDLARRFSIANLVFGSPKQRVIPDGLDLFRAQQIAAKLFRNLGEYAGRSNTILSIEPNPQEYGTNFLTNCRQAQEFVALVDHPSIGLNFDVGAILMNGDFGDIEELIVRSAATIHHVHISEPHLAPAPDDVGNTTRVLRVLRSVDYQHWVSIEMKPDPVNGLTTLETSIRKLIEAVQHASS
jgi:sugar phosphate isomerase/epimerase